MNELTLTEYKQPKNNFDWHNFVLKKIFHQFPRQALTGTPIPKKEVFRIFGLFMTMKKADTKIMLRSLEVDTDGLIHLNQRGVYINPEKLSLDQRTEIMQFLGGEHG